MLNSPCDAGYGSGGSMLRRVVPLLGLVLATAALLGATASSAAAAPVGLFIAGEKSEEKAKQPRFEAEKYTATIASKRVTGFNFVGQTVKLKCTEIQLPGTISAATSELKFTQAFSQCILAGLPTTIESNGCEFELNVLNVGPPYAGTTDIVCPTEKGIEFTAWLGPIGTEKGCVLSLLPQTGIEGLSFENTGTGTGRAITANFNLTTVKFTQVGVEGFGTCKTGEYTNGTFTTSVSLTASK